MSVGWRTCIQIIVRREQGGVISLDYLTLLGSGVVTVPPGQTVTLDLMNFAQRASPEDPELADITVGERVPGTKVRVVEPGGLYTTNAGEDEIRLDLSGPRWPRNASTARLDVHRQGMWRDKTGAVSLRVIDPASDTTVWRTERVFDSAEADSALLSLADVPAGTYFVEARSMSALNEAGAVRTLTKAPASPMLLAVTIGGSLVLAGLALHWRTNRSWKVALLAAIMGVLVTVVGAGAWRTRGGTITIDEPPNLVSLDPASRPVEPFDFPPRTRESVMQSNAAVPPLRHGLCRCFTRAATDRPAHVPTPWFRVSTGHREL